MGKAKHGDSSMTQPSRVPLPSGHRYGSYVIDGELKTTRLGRIYAAHRQERTQDVAIYVLHADLRESEEALFFDRSRRVYEWGAGQPENPMLDLCDQEGLLAIVFAREADPGRIIDIIEGRS